MNETLREIAELLERTTQQIDNAYRHSDSAEALCFAAGVAFAYVTTAREKVDGLIEYVAELEA